MMKKALMILLALLTAYASVGCIKTEPAPVSETQLPTSEATNPPEETPQDNLVWYCPFRCSPQSDSPAKVINILTGEVLVACPDPLCRHSASSETCFFNFVYDQTRVRAAEYANGHIAFIAERKTDDGMVMKLYDFSVDGGRIEEVYKFAFIPSTVAMYTNGSLFFFTSIGDDWEKDVKLYSYDPDDGKVTLIDDSAKYAVFGTDVMFLEDNYIFLSGYNAEEDRSRCCRRSYDGSSEEYFETLPDGTPLEIFGYNLKPSCSSFAKTEANGGVWLPEENRVLPFPTESAVTKPVRFGDSFYFTTRGSAFEELGKRPTGGNVMGYAYDNELYILNTDGSYRHYSIDCEYHFVLEAAYGNIVLGRIEYRLTSAGLCIEDNSCDIIRLDLDTGETTLYDTSARSGFAKKTFVSNVILNEN